MSETVTSDNASDSDFSLSDGDDGTFDMEVETQETGAEPLWQTALPGQYSDGRLIDRPAGLPRSKDNKHWQIYIQTPIHSAVVGTQDGPWFRLLKIYPGRFQDRLDCDLIRRPIFDSPKYQALSYSWGATNISGDLFLREIRVDVRVTWHLANALARLRQSEEVVFVWVDVLCIDQDNFIERAAQIVSMAQIYDQAESVRIWLGEDALEQKGFVSDDVLFQDLATYRNPWWRRLWIVQECAYAKVCPMVMIGPLVMSLQSLVDRWEQVTVRLRLKLSRQKRINDYQHMTRQLAYLQAPLEAWRKQARDNAVRLPLVVRLRETYWRECTEPHDRVYALLNLIDENEARQLQPDYRKPFETLWSQVLEVCRNSSSWQPERDEYLFSLEVLAMKEDLTNTKLGLEGEVIFAEAYNGNFEILPFLVQQVGVERHRISMMAYYSSFQIDENTRDITLDTDRQAAMNLLLMQDILYGTNANLPVANILLEIAVKNFLPRTTKALLDASDFMPTRNAMQYLLSAVDLKAANSDDQVAVVKAILHTCKTEINSATAVNSLFMSACRSAAHTGQPAIVAILLEAAKGSAHKSEYAYECLSAAGGRDNIPICDHVVQYILIELGELRPAAFVQATGPAIRLGKLQTIRWMLSRCEALHIAQDASVRLLEVSFRYKHMPSVELLLDYCVQESFREPTRANDTSLSSTEQADVQTAFDNGDMAHVVSLLKERGDRIHAYFWEILRSSCRSGRWQIADVLLESFMQREKADAAAAAREFTLPIRRNSDSSWVVV